MNAIQELINPETLNIVYIILAIGVGWIVLRFLLKLAGKIFQIGCLAIVVIGALLIIAQMIARRLSMPTIDQARDWYTVSDQVHDFDHVIRVYRLAEVLAEKEGADLEIVRAAALLHDAESASGDDQTRLAHHEAAADFAGKTLAEEGWPAERIQAVQECILSHRFRAGKAPETLEAKVLFDADKLDAIGAIGVARALWPMLSSTVSRCMPTLPDFPSTP